MYSTVFCRIDLVQAQIQVASGMTLPELGLTQDKIGVQVNNVICTDRIHLSQIPLKLKQKRLINKIYQ